MAQPANTNDAGFFNECMMEYPPGILTVFAESIHQFINPRLVGYIVLFFFIGYPLIFWVGENIFTHANYKRFVRSRLVLLHLLYRVTYTNCLVVILYALFRQRRPCSIGDVQLGSLYGMPSGDATIGSIVGLSIIMLAPWPTMPKYVVGISVIILKLFERVVMGLHSTGQVLAGSVLGILLHYYSLHVPIQHVIWETLVFAIVGPILLAIDHFEAFRDNDPNNMYSFFIYGMGFQVITCILLVRHMRKYFSDWRYCLKRSYMQLNSESVALVPFFKANTSTDTLIGPNGSGNSHNPVYSGAVRSSINSVVSVDEDTGLDIDGDFDADVGVTVGISGDPTLISSNADTHFMLRRPEYVRRVWVVADWRFTIVSLLILVVFIIASFLVQVYNPFSNSGPIIHTSGSVT